MTYAGESYAKKVARFTLWAQLANQTPTEHFRNWRYLVLSGPDGGDVRTLRVLGVPQSHITACDVNADALFSAEEALETTAGGRRTWGGPSSDFVVGDALEICKKRSRQFDVIFLDFCSPLSHKLTDYFIRCVCFGLKREGFAGLGVMYGRETPKMMKAVVVQREAMLARLADDTKSLADHQAELAAVAPRLAEVLEGFASKMTEADLITGREEAQKGGRLLNAAARWEAFSGVLTGRALDYNLGLFAALGLTYRSARIKGDGTSVGTPMLYYMGRASRPTKPLRREVLGRQVLRQIREYDQKHACLVTPVTCETEEDFRQLLCGFAREVGTAKIGEIFNVDAAKIAAWLAVETRRARASNE